MHRFLLAAILPALAFAQIPQCALTCTIQLVTAGAGGCTSVTDLTCICTSTDFETQAYQCYVNNCSAAELQAAEAYGTKICLANGTPITTSVTPSGITYPAGYSTGALSGTTIAGGSGFADNLSSASSFLSAASVSYSSALASITAFESGASLTSAEASLSSQYSGIVASVASGLSAAPAASQAA